MLFLDSIRSKCLSSLVMAFSFILFSCNDENDAKKDETGDGTPVSEISISISGSGSEGESVPLSTFELMKGETRKLSAVIMKGDQVYTGYKSVMWGSSNKKICSVSPSEDMLSCDVFATVEDNSFLGKQALVSISVDTGSGVLSATCIVTAVEVPVSGVEISSEEIQVEESGRKSVHVESGMKLQLDAIVSPENATIKEVVWESADQNVAVVNKEGLVQALKPSSDEGVKIIARSKSNNDIYDECYVIVDKVYATEMEFDDLENGQILEIDVNDTYLIDVYLYPENVTEKNITWVFNQDVVTVSNGLITPKPGTVGSTSEVTAKVQTQDGSYLEYTITVKVTGLQPDGDHNDLEDGGDFTGQ